MHTQKKEYTTWRQRNRWLVLIVGVVVVLVANWFVRTYSSHTRMQTGTEINQDIQLRNITDSSTHAIRFVRSSSEMEAVPIRVVVVTSPHSITQGLSGRATMPESGMLFVLPTTRIPDFWMIDMRFDLDMIWLRDLEVVDLTENVPAPDPATPASDLPTYSPSVPVNQVLEVPAGFVQQYNIRKGDRIEFVSD